MEQLTKNEQKLAKVLEIEEKITWQEYKERFNDDKPLKLSPTNQMPNKIYCLDTKNNLIGLGVSSKFGLKKLGNVDITIGFTKSIKESDINNMDVLPSTPYIGAIFRKHIIEKLLKICPDDFEVLPVTLETWSAKGEQFTNKDFYAINILKCIQAIDEEKSIIGWSKNGIAHIDKLIYKDNPWQEGVIPLRGPTSPRDRTKYPVHKMAEPCKIAIDAFSGAIIYHPYVAKIIPSHPYYYFITDKEQNKLRGIID